MHSAGFFHRDLKPENILVTQNCVKIADFGQVHELKTNGKKLTPYVSTRWYRAPEVLLGYRFYGPAIDLWAIGAIAAELMTLRPLFPGTTSLDQINKICQTLGSPSQLSHGGPWPLGNQLAALAGLRFPQQASGSLMKSLMTYPYLNPTCSRFVESLLQYDPSMRMSAKQALQHEFFAIDSQTSSPVSSFSGSLSTDSEELGLPTLNLSPGLSFYTSREMNQSDSDLDVSLLQDCSYTPSPVSDHFMQPCPSVPLKSPIHRDIPMQALHSLPIPNSKGHPRKQRWGAASGDTSPGFNESSIQRFSLYDAFDSPELRSLAISRSNTEPLEFNDAESPQLPKTVPLEKDASAQGEPKVSGLRRVSKIPQRELKGLRRLSCDYERLLTGESSSNPARSSLEAELLGLMDDTFNNIAPDATVRQLPGSLGRSAYSYCQPDNAPPSGAHTQPRRSLDYRALSSDQYGLAGSLSQPAPCPISPPPECQAVVKSHHRSRANSITNLFGKVRHIFGRGSRPVAPLPCTAGQGSKLKVGASEHWRDRIS